MGASLNSDLAVLGRAPRLEVMGSVSAGYDDYDLDYLRERGIRLTNTPHAVTETNANTAFLLLMMAARRAVEMVDLVRQGQWHEKNFVDLMFGTDVHGKRLGIIDLGRIGAAIARRGHFCFGMSVLYSGHSSKPALDTSWARNVWSSIKCWLRWTLSVFAYCCRMQPATFLVPGSLH